MPHRPVAVILQQQNAKTVDDVRRTVQALFEQLHRDDSQRPAARRFSAWRLGGRYATRVAEELPQLFRVQELLPDVTVGENRFSRAPGFSIFGSKLTLPVRELTDSLVRQFYWILLYRTLSWEERRRIAALTPAEKLKTVFGDDVIAIVDGYFDEINGDDSEPDPGSVPTAD